MGAHLGNIAIKHQSQKEVADYLMQLMPQGQEIKIYVSEEANGYVSIFPPNEDISFLEPLAKDLSTKFNTVVMCGAVYDSDDVITTFFNNGEVVYKYMFGSIERPMDEPEIQGSYADLAELLGKSSEIDLEEINNTLAERFTFAEDRYMDIILPLGYSGFLRNFGYRYIEREVASYEDGLEEFNSNPENLKLVVVS